MPPILSVSALAAQPGYRENAVAGAAAHDRPTTDRAPPQAGPSRPEPLDHINRMREDILAQIARDFPPRLHAVSLGVLAQDLLMQAAQRNGRAYARGWLDVIEAHLRNDIDAAAAAMMRLHPNPPASGNDA
jgi:hypothetical protein